MMSSPPQGDTRPTGDSDAATDEQLMERIAGGDRASFEALYELYSPLLYSICLKILRNPSDAQPVLHDVFWEVWRLAKRFDPERGTPRTYLMTLARSRAIDRLRGDRRRVATHQQAHLLGECSLEERMLSDEPAHKAIRSENGQLLGRAIQTLTSAQQNVLQCAYFEGLTHSEIAEKLDMPLGTVKTNIRQSLIKLRKVLRQLDPGGNES